MKKNLLKLAFGFSFLILWMLLFVSMLAAIDILFPVRRGADGLYPSVDRMPLVVIAIVSSAWLANGVTSLFFYFSRISEERWSVFNRRRS